MDSIIVVRFQNDTQSQRIHDAIKSYAGAKDIPYRLWDAGEYTDGAKFQHPLIISIGGDGTFLTAARYVLSVFPDNHAIYPINAGKLGFLTNGRAFNGLLINATLGTELLDFLLHGHPTIEQRMALNVCINGDSFVALNEVFLACSHNEMMTYTIGINGRCVAEQSGSGVLVSTSTGSTAQALSAGGAIISPDTNVMQIVPVVPHSLTSRPIVVTGRTTIDLSAKKTDRCKTICVHADGRDLYEMAKTDDELVTVEVMRHNKRVNVVRPPSWDFYKVLSTKMGWK